MNYLQCIKFWDLKNENHNGIMWFTTIGSFTPAILLLLFANISILSVVLILVFAVLGLLSLLFTPPFSCFFSYPFRYIKIRNLINRDKCFSRKSAGVILDCYVYNGNAEDLEHDWDGCKCKRCGEIRDKQHDWDGCKCKRCGKRRYEQHNWNGCKCERCDAKRDVEHDWDGCRCKRCGKTRDEQHDWRGCKCKRCDNTRDAEHDWNGCTCSRCGKGRDEQHDWDGCKCKWCGKTRDEQHDWELITDYVFDGHSEDGRPIIDTVEEVECYCCRRCGKKVKK